MVHCGRLWLTSLQPSQLNVLYLRSECARFSVVWEESFTTPVVHLGVESISCESVRGPLLYRIGFIRSEVNFSQALAP